MSNTITLVGNLTADPSMVTTPNGTFISKFSLAVNRLLKTTGTDGKPTSAVSFFNCVTFGDQAANAVESLRKGNRVVVTGRMDQRTWTDPQEQRHTTYEVVVDDVAVSLRFGTASVAAITRIRAADSTGEPRELVGVGAGSGPSSDREPF